MSSLLLLFLFLSVSQNKLTQGENSSQGVKGKASHASLSASSSSSKHHPARPISSSSHLSEKAHPSAGKTLSKSHQAQPLDRQSKHLPPPVPSTGNKQHQNSVKGSSSGTGSTIGPSARAKLPFLGQTPNNKGLSRQHEVNREMLEHAKQHQPPSHSGSHRYPYPPMPGAIKERHGKEVATGNLANRGVWHGSSSQHDATVPRTHSNHHQPQQLQPHMRSSNKRLHPSSTTTSSSSFSSTTSGSLEAVAKKKVKLDSQPPLPSMGYEDTPPPPPPPSQTHSYSVYRSSSSSSLPPLPPPVLDSSPPPPPPQ